MDVLMCYHWLYIFRSLAKFWLAHKASQNTTDEYKYTVIPHIEMINNSSKILFTKSLFWVSFDTFTWSTEELLNWSHRVQVSYDINFLNQICIICTAWETVLGWD